MPPGKEGQAGSPVKTHSFFAVTSLFFGETFGFSVETFLLLRETSGFFAGTSGFVLSECRFPTAAGIILEGA